MLSQAAEKAARAVCEHEDIPVGTTHSLLHISSLLPADHPFKRQILDLDHMSSASTKGRYPTSSGTVAKAPEPTKLKHDIEDVERFIERAEAFVKKPIASIPLAKQSDEKRKNALIEKIVAALKLRDIEIPADAGEKLFIYADERALHEMTKLTHRVGSFREMLDSQSISIPGYTDD